MENIKRHLAVRDYLRVHDDVALEYGKLKETLALKYPNDIEAYCDGKDDFVKQMERDALRWKEQKGWSCVIETKTVEALRNSTGYIK